MEEVKYSSFQALRPHFNALARVGYFKCVKKSLSPLKQVLHNYYRYFVWCIVITYNLQHLIKVIQVRQDTDQIVDILFILLTTLNTLGKQVAFNVRSKRIDEIISTIDGPIFKSRNVYHERLMKKNALVMQRLLRFYIGCIFTCGTLWTIFPLVNRAFGLEVQFTAYFPFDTDRPLNFEIALTYMSVLITFQAYGNVTMDCTIVAFYAQAKVQLQMLRYNLEHLVDVSKNEENEQSIYLDDNEVSRQRVQKRFVENVSHHQKILWFVKEIEDIFAEAMLFQFFVTAWVICMTVYKIVGLNLFSAEFLSMAMYLVCMLAQFFIYCYYGTQVEQASIFINQSIYCGDWLSLSPKFRRQILVMMINCCRPIVPRTAYVIPISLETYIAVLRASYTLFTFLDRK